MRVGFVQCQPVLGQVEQTIAHLEKLLPQADQAELIVLPELCNSGYNFDSPEQARTFSEEIPTSRMVDFLHEQCREHRFHVVCGLNERAGDRLYNMSVLIGPEGVLGSYRKIHLFLNEKDIFEPGDLGLPVFDIGICRVGMLICFDWVFPEVWRSLALDGADIICHPSNLVIPGLAQRAVPIQGLFNGVFTITANRVGTEKDLTFTGLSTIASNRGDILCQASADGEEVGVVEIDVAAARDKSITARNDRLADRRPDQYQRLTRQD